MSGCLNGGAVVFWTDLLGNSMKFKFPVVSLNFANSPVANCLKNLEEELPEADPENVNPVAWLKQFDIKDIVTSEPSKDSLDGNGWGFANSYGIMYPGHSTWTPNTFSHPLFGSNEEMLHVRKHLEGVLVLYVIMQYHTMVPKPETIWLLRPIMVHRWC